MSNAVFLDRDGVINRANVRNGRPYPPDNLYDVEILPNVPEAIDKLKSLGYLLIVITNQPDVARGKSTKASVEAINSFLKQKLPIDEFFTCYHDDSDKCDCRKPLPGGLLKMAQLFNIDLSKSFMIGDRWRDIEAGQRAGCNTIFIDYGYAEKRPVGSNFIVKSLFDGVEAILNIRENWDE